MIQVCCINPKDKGMRDWNNNQAQENSLPIKERGELWSEFKNRYNNAVRLKNESIPEGGIKFGELSCILP